VFDRIESERLAQQVRLDATKSAAERNRLGQFATPPALARDVLHYASKLVGRRRIRFLDPGLGTGAFYSALRDTFDAKAIRVAVGYEVDALYGDAAASLWGDHGLTVIGDDFTAATPRQFDLIVCNPPYVRHHHLGEDKARIVQRTRDLSGVTVSGLAGLYVHFLLQCHAWMAPGAVAGWLIPSEFMDVNYGRAVKYYLRERVTLLQIHRFDPNDVQFADALVSSAVVWIKNEPPPTSHRPLFTFGGTLAAPKASACIDPVDLGDACKWTRYPAASGAAITDTPRLGDYFTIKRGLATGDNSYFIMDESTARARHLPRSVLRPILPSPRYMDVDEVCADAAGLPTNAARLFLLDPRMDEDQISAKLPAVAAYLAEGRAAGLQERYLCRTKRRWYDQEKREPAPIVCTYFGRKGTKRGRPFRFIRNRTAATVANTYLALYPKQALQERLQRDPAAMDRIWLELNEIPADVLLGEGRVYGGGLHKLEPRELANVPLAAL
jgi:methylase of polypeptide subunit release factors